MKKKKKKKKSGSIDSDTRLIVHPLLSLQLYLALIYSILYIFFFAFPIIFGEIHGFTTGQVGLAFISILIGMLLAFVTVLPYQKHLYLKHHLAAEAKGTHVAPEARLPSMMFGSIVLPIGEFIRPVSQNPFDIHGY